MGLKKEAERATEALFAAASQVTAHVARDLSRNCKPQAIPIRIHRFAFCVLTSEELLKQMLLVFIRNANSEILNIKDKLLHLVGIPFGKFHAHENLRVIFAELDSVGKKIDQDLLDALRIYTHVDLHEVIMNLNCDVSGFCVVLHQ